MGKGLSSEYIGRIQDFIGCYDPEKHEVVGVVTNTKNHKAVLVRFFLPSSRRKLLSITFRG